MQPCLRPCRREGPARDPVEIAASASLSGEYGFETVNTVIFTSKRFHNTAQGRRTRRTWDLPFLS